MRSRVGHVAGTVIAAVLLGGCALDRDPSLMNLRQTQAGPDEFAILPNKPLQAPEDYSALPEPTPGAANRTDQTPEADVAEALGGQRGAVTGGGVRDTALVARTTRFGVEQGIRQTLADEDFRFRQVNNGLFLERLFNANVYFDAYRRQTLDQYAELERFRAAGVRTPAVPPEPER